MSRPRAAPASADPRHNRAFGITPYGPLLGASLALLLYPFIGTSRLDEFVLDSAVGIVLLAALAGIPGDLQQQMRDRTAWGDVLGMQTTRGEPQS